MTLPISNCRFLIVRLAKGQLAIANPQSAIGIINARYRARTVPSGPPLDFNRQHPNCITT